MFQSPLLAAMAEPQMEQPAWAATAVNQTKIHTVLVKWPATANQAEAKAATAETAAPLQAVTAETAATQSALATKFSTCQ